VADMDCAGGLLRDPIIFPMENVNGLPDKPGSMIPARGGERSVF